MTFNVEAVDSDGDELSYAYMLSDTCVASMDSILATGSSAEFQAVNGGFYCIQARVYDGASYAYRNWYITVIEEHNEAPRIVSVTPDIDSLSCLIGNTVEFRIGATDDNPSVLRYTYRVNGVVIKNLSTSPIFTHRFGENGRYDVVGTVTDWEFHVSMEWHINVIGDPDTVAPSGIYDLEGWTGIQPGSIQLRWTAPGDDGNEGRCLAYKVKTATNPILTEDDWLKASIKYDSPEPGIAGTVENMTAVNCYPGTFLFVTARAADDFGNLGPIGNCIRLLVRGYDASGVVTDAGTGEPLEGVLVSVNMIADTTDAQGVYLLRNLPKYSEILRVKDENDPGEPGIYYDISRQIDEPRDHFTLNLQMMPYYGLVSCNDNWYEDFLAFFKDLTSTTGLYTEPVFYGWNHWPLKVYNPPMIFREVDLQDVARGSMASWEAGTGLDLFVEVEDPALADWKIVYFETGDDKHKTKTVLENPDGTPLKKEVWIYLENTLSPIAIQGHMIFAHEFGHVLGAKHSYDTGHLMVGMTTPWVKDPSEDELRLIRVIYHYPPIWRSDWIEEN
ncbi:MAG: hypothetical protein MUF59_03940 [Candidatus Krumholzibacteria bacterium]|nr:hypothetical protein [Candidatus Krumholzibacteria bacterium]